MQNKLRWEGHTNLDRTIAIAAVKDLILQNDGCIINFSMFSDLALSLSVEIEGRHITALHQKLSSILNMDELNTVFTNSNTSKEWLIFINLSFSSGSGTLINEIPSVPG